MKISNLGKETHKVIRLTTVMASLAFSSSIFAQVDFSDAPASYGSPSHTMSADLYMGECVDDELAAQPDATAGGDDTGIDNGTVHGLCSDFSPSPPNPFRDDEDIIELFTITDGQSSPQFSINIINSTAAAATAKCWIDYNGNGVFENTALESPPSATVTTTGPTATILFSDVPANANAATGGITFLRCRIASSAAEVANPTGSAGTGEVEDHRVIVYEQISVCPAGSVQIPFNWSPLGWTGPGNGSTGTINSEVGSTNETAALPYVNSLGQAQTLNVTASIIDPNERNCDGDPYDQGNGIPFGPWLPVNDGGDNRTPWTSDHHSPTPVSSPSISSCSRNGTRVNGNLFEFRINTVTSDENVTLRMTMDQPVYVTNYTAADIDRSGLGVSGGTSIYEAPGNSFQDEVFFQAELDGEDVALNLSYGAQIIPNGAQGGYGGPYALFTNNNLNPANPAGHITVQPTPGKPFNRIDVTYSNGPDDAAAEQNNPGLYSWWSNPRGATNGASDGHLVILESFEFCGVDVVDFGDAPDASRGSRPGNYNTQTNDLGASHVVSNSGPFLGDCVDADNGTQQDGLAASDDITGPNNAGEVAGTCLGIDDEDGVVMPASILVGTTGTISVRAGGVGNGFLNAWIDYNFNGVFEATEQIANDLALVSGGAPTAINVNVPSTAIVATTFARFRYSSAGGDSPIGPASDGEVEDYPLVLAAEKVSIGNLIWMDNGAGAGGVANDGIQNGSEAGVGGVTVELYLSGADPLATTAFATTTSNPDGTYVFDGVDPDDYFVHIPPSMFADGTGPLDGKISSSGQGVSNSDLDQNGLVFSDDGSDPTDPAVSGVSSNVYQISVDGEPTNDDESGTAVSTEDDNNTNFSIDFAFYQPISIGNLVWMDNGAGLGIANNGIQDGSEAGVPGVNVELYASTEIVGGTTSGTTTTLADGSYVFNDIVPGSYFVHLAASNFAEGGSPGVLVDKVSTTGQEADPSDLDQGASANSDNGVDGGTPLTDGISSNVYAFIGGAEPVDDDETIANSLARPNQGDADTNFSIDFAVYQPVSIGNKVWMDDGQAGGIANNGIQDGGEIGVPNVEVELHPSTVGLAAEAATPLLMVTSEADGSYIFDSVAPGSYIVHLPASNFAVAGPLESKISTTGQGGVNSDIDQGGAVNSDDGDDLGTPTATGVSSLAYDVEANSEPINDDESGASLSSEDDNNTNFTIDFGFYELVSIGNLVWMDNGGATGAGIANNGVFDGDEVGVSGLVVELHLASVANPETATPFASTTTATDGSYILSGPPGMYVVHIPSEEFAIARPLAGKVSTTGQSGQDIDDNVPGSDDGDDNEADGITSTAYELIPDGELVGETGFVGTTVSPSSDNSTNSTADFSFYEPVSIGNLVWLDDGAGGGAANDGIKQAGEAGVPGVVVQLFTQGQATNTTPFATTATAADGSYIFDSVAPGSYFVHIPASEFGAGEPLEAKVSTTGQAAADNTDDDNVGEDGDDNEADGVSSGVYVLLGGDEPSGEAGFVGTSVSTQDDNNTNLTADFGFYQPVAIGNVVWMDNGAGSGISNDGIKQAGELGVAGVVVQLFAQGQATNTTPVDSTTTAADGSYILTASPGSYFVHIPASEFAATEPLEEKVSTTGQGAADNTDDDNVAEDGDDTEADGVSSLVYDLQPGLEPTSEAGFVGTTVSPVADNNTNSTADFGFYQPVSIGNLVWMDNGAGGGISNDGIKQAGETGVPGVVIELYAAGDTPGVDAVADSTTTAADGSYILTTSPGSYFVHIPASEFAATEPLEEKVSTTGQGAADNTDDDNVGEDGDDIEADGVSSGVYDLQPNLEPTSEAGFIGTTVSPSDDNNTNSTADFGFYQPVSIGNLVWMDNGAGGGISNDGIKQAGEVGVPGVDIELYAAGDTPGVDTAAANTTSAADGSYIFDSIAPGSYFVHIPASEFGTGEPLEAKVSTTGQGAADNTDDDNVGEDGDDNETDGVSSGVYVLLGGDEPSGEAGFVGTSVSTQDDNNTNLTADFGFYQPVAIGNVVWMDNGAGGGISNDGIKQAGELGVAGVVVQLFAQGQATNTTPVDSTTTAADGSYILTASPGSYFVHIPASEFAATEPLEEKVSTTGQGAADNTDDDNVAEDGDDTEADGVSSLVYDLQPGLEPTSEAGFVGTTVSPVADNNTNSTADFGFYQPVSIGNLVWMDNGAGGGISNDGIKQAGEAGVPDVVVQLFTQGQATNTTPFATTATAGDGSYIFDSVAPDSYFVHIPASEFGAGEPLEAKVSTTGQGAADNTDDDNVGEDGDDNETDGVSSGVYVLLGGDEPSGEAGFVGTSVSTQDDNNTNLTADFGFYQPVAIGNVVWMDNGAGGGISNDGIKQAGELGVAGAVIELYAAGDTPGVDAVADSTTTAADGSYILTTSPGSYFVHIPASEFAATEPLEDKVSTTGQGAADNTDDDNVGEDGDDTETDGVSSGAYDLQPNLEPTSEAGFVGTTVSPVDDNNTNSTADFGFYQPVSIGNLVWMDNGAGGGISNDGIKQAGETGVPGVVIELYAAGDTPGVDAVADSTTTAADGSYILTTSPGSYFVHIPASEFAATEPLEEKVSTTGQGAADNTDDDNVGEDGDDIEVDGVSSGVYDLQPNLEPTSEAGFIGTTVSPSDDNNTNSTADFGFYQPVSIGNLVWMDNGAGGGISNDGIKQAGEVGVPGVDIELYAAGDTPGVDTAVANTTSAADGSYIFDSIAPGSYFVHIPASEFGTGEPLEAKVSTTGQGAADNTDDDNVGEDGDDNETDGVSSGVYVLLGGDEPSGEAGFVGTSVSTQDDNNTNLTADFGFYQPVAIGNVVWMDNGAGGGISNDGIKQAGELGVAGAVIELYAAGDTPGVDAVADSTTTAADGSYILTTSPGSYFVHIPASEFAATEPLEDKVSTTGQGAADNTDDDNVGEDGDDTETDGVSSGAYDLQPNLEPTSEAGFVGTTVSPVDDNNTNSTADFGFYQPVSIGNLVWMDNGAGGGISNDGIKQAGETGVPGVVIELYAAGDTPGVDAVADSTTTAADGSYILTTSPGSYFVHIPASEFAATEPLEEKVSTTGQGAADNTDDDNVGEDGDDIEADGVSSGVYDLQPNLEPTSEAGFIGTTVSPSDDNNTNSTADFGFYQPVSIGNLVWMDNGAGGGISNDGIKQAGEVGVPGVDIELYAAGDTPGVDTAAANTTSAADGSYIFDSIAPGSYFVHIPASEFGAGEPLEAKVSTTGQGAADNTDDDNVGEDGDDNETDGVSSGVYVLLGGDEPSGEAGFVGTSVGTQDDNNTNSTADFGFLVPSSVGSFVWEDLNGDGLQQAGEPPLAGTELSLMIDLGGGFVTAQDLQGNPVLAQTTVSDGVYFFGNLPAGTYKLQVSPPAGYFASPVQTTGNDDDTENDSNIAGETGPGTNVFDSGSFTLESGLEPNEVGDLLRGDNQDGAPGSPVDLSGNMTIDFAFAATAEIGNYVWLDLDMDGVQDANEEGIAGVDVTLTPPLGVDVGNGIDVPVTVSTGPNGEYLFAKLPPYTNTDLSMGYVVTVDPNTLPPSLAQTYDEGVLPGSVGVLDNSSEAIQLSPREEHLTADFGYAPPIGSLGDTIWVDADDDGVQDPGEPGIAGVDVSLTPAPDVDLGNGSGIPVVTTTDANGKYLFTGLTLNETYIVAVDVLTLPIDYFSSVSGLGDPDVRDGNSTNADDQTTVVLTTDDPVNLDSDFGYLPPESQNNSVGDTIWIDADSDGQGPLGTPGGGDTDEQIVPGVTVSLVESTASNLIATTITDESGQYLFTGIPDGEYTVSVTDQNNVLAGLDPTYDSDGITTPNTSLVNLDSAGTEPNAVENLEQDFGYVDSTSNTGVGSIGDTIFFDSNDSGAPDDGEGIEGVTVQLDAPGPNGLIGGGDDILIASTVTDENGNYLFTGLDASDTGPNPGTEYRVVVDVASLPNGGAGWVNSVDPDVAGNGDNESTTSLTTAAPTDLLRDFGYVSDDNNSITGSVWPDTDGNGEQEETGGFGGVSVELRDENGNVIQTAITEPDGTFSFDGLPDGVYVVVITDDDNVLNGYEHTDSPNGLGDTTDETSKDDTGYIVDLDSEGESDTPVNDETSDFGYEPVVTNPISLGSFYAKAADGGHVSIDWATQTEVANLGFNVYAQVDGDWIQLNNSLIVSQGDSVSVQSYNLSALTSAKVFGLSDIDLNGNETLHGPFALGQEHGSIGTRRSIDWASEKAERETKQRERDARRKVQQLERNQLRRLKRAEIQQQRLNADSQEVSMLEKFINHSIATTLALLVPSAHAVQSNGAAGEDVVNLTTQDSGLYEVSFSDLVAFDVDLDGTPIVDIALLNRGSSVPVQVTGSNADPLLFGAGSKVRFIAKELNTLYSDTNVYTLRLDQSAQALMPVQTLAVPIGPAANAYLAKAKYAPQNSYSFVSPDQQDPWYANRVVAVGSPKTEEVILKLDHVAQVADQSAAKLNVNVWGSTDLAGPGKDHHVTVQINGQTVMDSRFDGLQSRQLQANIDTVVEGENSISLTLPMDTGFAFDAININEIEIRYPRQFMAKANRIDFESSAAKFSLKGFSGSALRNGAADLVVFKEGSNGLTSDVKGSTVLCRPSSCRIEVAGDGQLGHYYVAAKSAIRKAGLASLPVTQDIQSGGAAYLIISHPDFIGSAGNNQLEALAGEMSSEYGSADVVSVDAIYAQYGHHIFDPQAIRSYIKDAARPINQGGRGTEVVLLVGGDVYDYRGYENEGAQSFIPSIYAATGNNITFAPVDAKYADIDDDNVPDLAIARLPVRTTTQLSSLLSKRADYKARDYSGKMLLVADEYDELQQYDFANDADEIEADFLDGLSISKAYVDDFKANGQGVAQARTAIISGINEGQTMTAFFGHSSTNQWSFNGLFNGPDAANLQNDGKPTVVAQWGCWNTYYVSPNEDSMGHRLMMEGNQGAVAVMGATTLTDANAERELARLVFERLGNGERLGEAVTNAKQVYAQSNPNNLDVLLGWTILGLPELRVN